MGAWALGISGINFCPGIRFWEVNFAWALGFGHFLTKNVQYWMSEKSDLLAKNFQAWHSKSNENLSSH